MRVVLIASTAHVGYIPGYNPHTVFVDTPDELAEQAGRLCYESWERPNPKTSTNEGYIDNIISQGHYSVLEHASATFYIDGVTRNLTHELIRHRHFSFSEVSQRYVDVGEFPVVEHPGLAEMSPETREKFDKAIEASKDVYQSLVTDLTGNDNGRKKARQAARHILPSGTETKILITGNMRAWREMLWKRLSPMADAEIQVLANLLLDQLLNVSTNIFRDLEEYRQNGSK